MKRVSSLTEEAASKSSSNMDDFYQRLFIVNIGATEEADKESM